MAKEIDGDFEVAGEGQQPRGIRNKNLPWKKKDAALITDARRSPLENWEHRKRMYAILQGSRIPFLMASAVTYMMMHNLLLSAVLFCISIPLPWIAVVIANGVGEPHDSRAKQVYKPQAARAQAAQYEALQAQQRAQLEAREATSDNLPAVIDHVESDSNVIDHVSDHVGDDSTNHSTPHDDSTK